MRKMALGVVLVLVLLALSGCTAGPNDLANQPDEGGEVAGFWQGLWHGIIAPITFLVSLFDDDVNIYDVHNNGNWYDFGFMVGIGIILGGGAGGGAGAGSRRR